jgi:hypothetical protein
MENIITEYMFQLTTFDKHLHVVHDKTIVTNTKTLTVPLPLGYELQAQTHDDDPACLQIGSKTYCLKHVSTRVKSKLENSR